jgi:hypothetical protein
LWPPRLASDGQSANHLGTRYALQYAYEARTTYVAGEFYWKVERGQTSFNRDFANGTALLSMEKSGQEITWSSGRRIDSAQVAAAFGQDARKALFKRSDAAPLSSAPRIGCGTAVLILIVLIVLLIILSTCSGGGTSSGYGGRSAGGSYGGYSSGGSHK